VSAERVRVGSLDLLPKYKGGRHRHVLHLQEKGEVEAQDTAMAAERGTSNKKTKKRVVIKIAIKIAMFLIHH
jgi:hypothetical protein